MFLVEFVQADDIFVFCFIYVLFVWWVIYDKSLNLTLHVCVCVCVCVCEALFMFELNEWKLNFLIN